MCFQKLPYHIDTQHNIIRFSTSFNEPLDDYYSIIHSYNKIYFGFAFDQPIVLTKYIILFSTSSMFNQPFDTTKYLTTLILDYRFNQHIILNKNIHDLTFGYSYNKYLTLPKNISYLSFGVFFNQPFVLSKKLTHLTLGCNFNNPIVLVKSLKVLIMTRIKDNDHHFILTPNVRFLKPSIDCKNRIVIEKPIQTLTISNNNYHIIDNLPQNITNIVLDGNFDLPMDNLPNDVKHIELCNYGYSHTIPKFF